MASKVEILEALLLNGGEITQAKLSRIFGHSPSSGISLLLHHSWIKRYIKNGNELIDLKYSTLPRGKSSEGKIILKLTDSAYRYLAKHNAKSFYDTPMRIIAEANLKRPLIPREKLAELIGKVD